MGKTHVLQQTETDRACHLDTEPTEAQPTTKYQKNHRQKFET